MEASWSAGLLLIQNYFKIGSSICECYTSAHIKFVKFYTIIQLRAFRIRAVILRHVFRSLKQQKKLIISSYLNQRKPHSGLALGSLLRLPQYLDVLGFLQRILHTSLIFVNNCVFINSVLHGYPCEGSRLSNCVIELVYR